MSLSLTAHKAVKSNKIRAIVTMSVALLAISGCQSLPKNQVVTTPTTIPAEKLSDFNINGKIGVTMPADTGTQGGSAFYAWVRPMSVLPLSSLVLWVSVKLTSNTMVRPQR